MVRCATSLAAVRVLCSHGVPWLVDCSRGRAGSHAVVPCTLLLRRRLPYSHECRRVMLRPSRSTKGDWRHEQRRDQRGRASERVTQERGRDICFSASCWLITECLLFCAISKVNPFPIHLPPASPPYIHLRFHIPERDSRVSRRLPPVTIHTTAVRLEKKTVGSQYTQSRPRHRDHWFTGLQPTPLRHASTAWVWLWQAREQSLQACGDGFPTPPWACGDRLRERNECSDNGTARRDERRRP